MRVGGSRPLLDNVQKKDTFLWLPLAKPAFRECFRKKKPSTTQIVTLKSRIRETKHLSTDADSSTDAIGGWTKAKSAKTKLFFCAAILDHFQTKMFKC